MIEKFLFVFSILLLFVESFIIIFKKWEFLVRGIWFSISATAILSFFDLVGILPISENIKTVFKSSELIQECEKDFRKKFYGFHSAKELGMMLGIKEALGVDNPEEFLENLDPILRERVILVAEEFIDEIPFQEGVEVSINLCEIIKRFEVMGLSPGKKLVIKSSERIDPWLLSSWFQKAEGFIYENMVFISPEKLLKMLGEFKTPTDVYDVSVENRKEEIILYIKKR